MELLELGFSDWFKDRIDRAKLNNFVIARVLTVNKNNYRIINENTDVLAEITGKIIFGAETALDYPTVGDWVYAQFFNNNTFALIHEILPRKSILKRKTSGKKIDYQLIATNIDFAFIIQSLDLNFNINRLERYLVMIKDTNIKPIILLSKCDLVSQGEWDEKVSKIKNLQKNVPVIAFSNKSGDGLNNIKKLLIPGQTYCLLGSSGVGKTTLLNNLLGKDQLATQAVRERDSKGRHTTTRRQLLILENGAIIIDTPGMRELGNFGVETGIDETYDEITELAFQCRFNDCTHTNEKGCAILHAITEGLLPIERYENYQKLKKESAHYSMSYVAKRKRDKKFGKLYKEIMKNKIKK